MLMSWLVLQTESQVELNSQRQALVHLQLSVTELSTPVIIMNDILSHSQLMVRARYIVVHLNIHVGILYIFVVATLQLRGK